MKIHPGDLMLEELLLLSLRGERKMLLRHLATCPHCQTRLGRTVAHGRMHSGRLPASSILASIDLLGSTASRVVSVGSPHDYRSAVERTERLYLERARALRQERADAPGLLSELLGHRPEKRQLVMANSSRFHTWGLYEALLDRSWDLRTFARPEAENLARLALDLSAYLDHQYYSEELIEDLRARSWSYIANLRRISSDLEGAEQAFAVAYAHLKRGTREPLERALYLDLKASLRGAQRRFDEAKRLLHRVVTIFLHHKDEHRAGKSLVTLAAIYNFAGQIEEAVPLLERALELIDPNQDEHLVLCAWHNLIDALAMLGRFIEAQGLYRRARPLYRRSKDSVLDHRRLWVKGKIERGLGQEKSAESLFLAAREGFLAQDMPYDAAVVSMEIAILYAEQERLAELKQLASEMLLIFASRHIHREAFAALMFLKQAVDAEQLTIQTAASIADFLRRAEAEPGIKFQAPAD